MATVFTAQKVIESQIWVADEAGVDRYKSGDGWLHSHTERGSDHAGRPVLRIWSYEQDGDPIQPQDEALGQFQLSGLMTGLEPDPTDEDGDLVIGDPIYPTHPEHGAIWRPGYHEVTQEAPLDDEADLVPRLPGWKTRSYGATDAPAERFPETILRFPTRVNRREKSGLHGFVLRIAKAKGMAQLADYRIAVADETFDPANPDPAALMYMLNNPRWELKTKNNGLQYYEAETEADEATPDPIAATFVLLPDGSQQMVCWKKMPLNKDRIDAQLFLEARQVP